MLESYAVQEFHGDEGLALVVADVVNRTNVWMVESGSGLGFPLETGQGLRVPGEIIGEEFQGDKSVEARVLGFVDNAHAAATELFDDAVVGDGLPDQGGVRHLADMLGCEQRQVNEESRGAALMDADLAAEVQLRCGSAQ